MRKTGGIIGFHNKFPNNDKSYLFSSSVPVRTVDPLDAKICLNLIKQINTLKTIITTSIRK